MKFDTTKLKFARYSWGDFVGEILICHICGSLIIDIVNHAKFHFPDNDEQEAPSEPHGFVAKMHVTGSSVTNNEQPYVPKTARMLTSTHTPSRSWIPKFLRRGKCKK